MPSLGHGTELGRYKIESELGAGGMSVVYRANDPKLQRTVAVKVMHDYLAQNKDAKTRFHREALAVAQLQHPNIIKILDYAGEETDKLYIVMELVDGSSLAALTANKEAFSPPEFALLLARPIADALHHAHSAGIIHRDLKPENILIGVDGTVKLTDFGIARMVDKQTMTMTGTLLGSPAFMAPEYIAGEPTDHRADIFSFGAMLYQLTTGLLPFQGESPAALLLAITKGTYDPPAKHNPRIHRNIARIIDRCMAKDPKNRYGTADDLRADIDAVLAQAGIPEGGQLHLKEALENRSRFSQQLENDLVGTYFELGKTALENGHTGTALEHFDRVLSQEPEHKEVRALMLSLEKRSWGKKLAFLVATAAIFIGVLTLGIKALPPDLFDPTSATVPAQPTTKPAVSPKTVAPKQRSVGFVFEGRGDLYVDGNLVAKGIFNSFATLVSPGEHTVRFVGPLDQDEQSFTVYEQGPVDPIRLKVRSEVEKPNPPPMPTPQPVPAAKPQPAIVEPKPIQAKAGQTREVTFRTDGGWAHVDLNGKRIANNKFGKFRLEIPHGRHKVRFTNTDALPEEMTLVVNESQPPVGSPIVIRLKPKPALLYLTGEPNGSLVRIAGRAYPRDALTRGDPIHVQLPKGKGRHAYRLSVEDNGKVIFEKTVEFSAGKRLDVAVAGQPK